MKKRLFNIFAAILSLLIIGAAVIAKNHGSNKAPNENRQISQAVLAKANGKNGQLCYVAVDGVVYEIKNSPYWVNGEHTTSEGQAHCGLDLSNVIDKAPHGRSKLLQLDKVGRLSN